MSLVPLFRSECDPALLGSRKLRAAVVLPGGLVVSGHGGAGLAVAHGSQLRGRHPEVYEVALDRTRAAFAKGEVVFFAAALIRVTLDRDRAPPFQ